MKKAIKKVFVKILDFLIPPVCGICDEPVMETATLCAKCFAALTFIREPRCTVCGRPFEYDILGERTCSKCLMKRPIYAKARSALAYDDASKKLILPFKNGDRLDLAPLLVKLMSNAAPNLLTEADVLVPIPLHRLRLLKRKYNQSAVLAMKLAKKFEKKCLPSALVRVRATPSQGHLSPAERKKNVRGAFKVRAPEKIKGKKILLIDDVLTTGATANECAKVLLKVGAKEVSLLTLASTVPNRKNKDDIADFNALLREKSKKKHKKICFFGHFRVK